LRSHAVPGFDGLDGSFARRHFADILGARDFIIAKDYPARGGVARLPAAAA